MTKYRISYEPSVGTSIAYCVEEKIFLFWMYVPNSWFKTENEAKEFIDKLILFKEKSKKIYYP